MKYTVDDIVAFVRSSGVKAKEISGGTSLGGDLNIWGDDLDELLIDYAHEFGVDMSAYLWYFHSKEEGMNTGALFFKPPNKRVDHIPITIDLMAEAANTGSWPVKYPEHKLPKYRLDTLVSQIVFAGFVIYLIVSSIKGCR